MHTVYPYIYLPYRYITTPLISWLYNYVFITILQMIPSISKKYISQYYFSNNVYYLLYDYWLNPLALYAIINITVHCVFPSIYIHNKLTAINKIYFSRQNNSTLNHRILLPYSFNYPEIKQISIKIFRKFSP